MATFLDAALVMFRERGWLCHPLRLDPNNLPKVPITAAWSTLEPSEETIQSLAWDRAAGIGIILGARSRNLGVLDIDCEPLFNVLVAALGFSDAPRLVRTARNRGHYYCYTEGPCQSTWREVLWDGEKVKIELKTDGTQVACPPSPGYKLLNQNPPQPFPDMELAWEFFCDVMLHFAPKHFSLPPPGALQPTGGANYPKPWSAQVPESERNKTAYMEAQTLREAGATFEVALHLMQARFSQDYAKGGIAWREIEATVRSAYRKGEVVPKGGYGGVTI